MVRRCSDVRRRTEASAAATCCTECPSTTKPVSPCDDRLGRAARIAGDHRQAGERGLCEDDAEAFDLEAGPATAAGRGEDVGGLQPLLHRVVGERAGEVHALAHAALLGAVVQAGGQPALADDHEVQVRELAAKEGQGVDELVLALARHQTADADDDLAVDAEALAKARGLLVRAPARSPRRAAAAAAPPRAPCHRSACARRRAVYSLTVSSMAALPSTCRSRLFTPGTTPGSVTSAPPRKTT